MWKEEKAISRLLINSNGVFNSSIALVVKQKIVIKFITVSHIFYSWCYLNYLWQGGFQLPRLCDHRFEFCSGDWYFYMIFCTKLWRRTPCKGLTVRSINRQNSLCLTRSRWPCGLMPRFSADFLLGFRVRFQLVVGTFCLFWVLCVFR